MHRSAINCTSSFRREACMSKIAGWRWIFLVAWVWGAPIANAEYLPDALTVRGFGTVGMARSSSASGEFVRDLSQSRGIKDGQWSGRIDTILGVQVNWQAAKDVELVAQVVSRLRYDGSRNPELMWAFAKWESDESLALRMGRIGADFVMQADSRLVGFSYLTVRPSADFFGPLFFSHFDGADMTLSQPLGNGMLRGKLFVGRTHEKAAGTPGVWDTSGSAVNGLVFDFQRGAWLFRLNSANIRFAEEINSYGMPGMLRAAAGATGVGQANTAAGSLSTHGKWGRFLSLGAVYDDGPLFLQGMINRIAQDSEVFQDSHAGFFLAGYRLGGVTPFAGVSRWISRGGPYSTGLPPGFAALSQNYMRYMMASHVNQTTYTLGVRWDVLPNVALKLQWDGVRGKPDSHFPIAHPGVDWNGRTDVVSGVMDFVF